jgi:hypothetical protein
VQGFPGVGDIAGRPPAITASRSALLPDFYHTILAESVNNIPVLITQISVHQYFLSATVHSSL